MIVKRLGMIRDTNFEKLYALMGQELGMDRMPYIVYQSDGFHWEKLLQYSERYYSFCDRNGLLFPVLHKIHWQQYPDCEYSDLQKEMLSVLEEVIRTDAFSKETWIKGEYFLHQVCMMRISQTADTKAAPYYLSECHEFYMNCRGNNVMYCKGTKQDDEKEPFPDIYEAIIKEILPDAYAWPAEAWSSEKKIYEGLAEKYGIAYLGINEFVDAMEYSALVYLLQCKYEGKAYGIRDLTNLHICTMDMAAVLWPQNPKGEMIREFLRFGEAVLSGDIPQFARKDLYDCWLYKQVCEWMDKDDIPSNLHHEVKKARFDMELLGRQ